MSSSGVYNDVEERRPFAEDDSPAHEFDAVALESPSELSTNRALEEHRAANSEANSVLAPSCVMLVLSLVLSAAAQHLRAAAYLILPTFLGIFGSALHIALSSTRTATLKRERRAFANLVIIVLISAALLFNAICSATLAGLAATTQLVQSWVVLPLMLWLVAYSICCAFFINRLRHVRSAV